MTICSSNPLQLEEIILPVPLFRTEHLEQMEHLEQLTANAQEISPAGRNDGLDWTNKEAPLGVWGF